MPGLCALGAMAYLPRGTRRGVAGATTPAHGISRQPGQRAGPGNCQGRSGCGRPFLMAGSPHIRPVDGHPPIQVHPPIRPRLASHGATSAPCGPIRRAPNPTPATGRASFENCPLDLTD